MRTIASLRPFPMSAGNFVGNTIEKAAVLPISIPPRKKYLVYSLFTQGEASGLCYPTRKSVPNQGTYMGLVIAYRPEQCSTTAKTSEWERAAPKPRGGGGYPPATLCVRAFSRESLDPPPGTGREPTSQVLTCAGLEGTTYRAPKAKGERQRRSPFIRCRGTITVPHPRRTA